MLWFRRILLSLFLIAAFLLSLAFLTENESAVSISFFIYELDTTTGGSFIFGMILGLLATLISTWPLIATYKFKLNRAQKSQISEPADE